MCIYMYTKSLVNHSAVMLEKNGTPLDPVVQMCIKT